MHPSSISHSFSMDEYFPVSPSSMTPHYAVGVLNAPAKRKRADPTPLDGATRFNTMQSAVDPTESWFPMTGQSAASATPRFTDSSITYPFSHYAPHTTSEDYLQGSSRASVTTEESIDEFLRGVTPQHLQDAPEPPSKRRHVSRARRGSSHSMRTGNSILSVPPFPYSPNVFPTFTFMPTASPFDSDSSVEGSSTEVSQTQTTSPVLHSATAFVPLPSPGALDGIYPHYAPGLASTFYYPDLDFNSLESILARVPMRIPEHVNQASLEGYELPPFDPGNNGADSTAVGGVSWRPAYNNTQAHVSSGGPTSHRPKPNTRARVSANGSTAPGVSPGPKNFPPPTTPAPSISNSRLLENDAPEGGVPLRRHASGVVTYFNPRASSPLPQGTRLQLACGHSEQDERVRCLYRDPFNGPDCNEDLVDFRGWKRHFKIHASAEDLYLEDHPEASNRAVALKDPEYVNAKVWICKFCSKRGRKSGRKDALKRHWKTCKRSPDLLYGSHAGGGAGGQFEFVPPQSVFNFRPPSPQRYYNVASGSSLPL